MKQKRKTVGKLCIVDSCNNNSYNRPEKLFLTIPKNPQRRAKWAKALGFSHLPLQSRYRVCEDHFNLAEDSQNWLYYLMMGTTKLMLKLDVVPHRFIDKPPEQDLGSQLPEVRKKRLSKDCSKLKEMKNKNQSLLRKNSILKRTSVPQDTENVPIVIVQNDLEPMANVEIENGTIMKIGEENYIIQEEILELVQFEPSLESGIQKDCVLGLVQFEPSVGNGEKINTIQEESIVELLQCRPSIETGIQEETIEELVKSESPMEIEIKNEIIEEFEEHEPLLKTEIKEEIVEEPLEYKPLIKTEINEETIEEFVKSEPSVKTETKDELVTTELSLETGREISKH